MNERPGVLLNGMRKDCSSEFGNWDWLLFQNDGPGKLDRLIEKYRDEIPGKHGTPSGIGLGMDPPAYPTEGDIVELTI